MRDEETGKRFLFSMMKDIDSIIEGVRREVPAVDVVQMDKVHTADDDGVWWFRVPGCGRDIQVESSSYDCPFQIEHDDMKSSAEEITGHSVDEVVKVVSCYLRSLMDGSNGLG